LNARVLADQFELISARTVPLSIIPRKGRAARSERRRGCSPARFLPLIGAELFQAGNEWSELKAHSRLKPNTLALCFLWKLQYHV
jgi:hypothetical protein